MRTGLAALAGAEWSLAADAGGERLGFGVLAGGAAVELGAQIGGRDGGEIGHDL